VIREDFRDLLTLRPRAQPGAKPAYGGGNRPFSNLGELREEIETFQHELGATTQPREATDGRRQTVNVSLARENKQSGCTRDELVGRPGPHRVLLRRELLSKHSKLVERPEELGRDRNDDQEGGLRELLLELEGLEGRLDNILVVTVEALESVRQGEAVPPKAESLASLEKPTRGKPNVLVFVALALDKNRNDRVTAIWENLIEPPPPLVEARVDLRPGELLGAVVSKDRPHDRRERLDPPLVEELLGRRRPCCAIFRLELLKNLPLDVARPSPPAERPHDRESQNDIPELLHGSS